MKEDEIAVNPSASILHVLPASIAVILTSTVLAQGQGTEQVPVSVDIDVVDMLYKNLGIPKERIRTGKCYAKKHGGMHAKIPNCDFYYEFSNLTVSAWSDIKHGEVEVSRVPTSLSTKQGGYRNCSGEKHQRPVTLTIETYEGLEVTTTKGLDKVNASSTTLTLSTKVLEAVGVQWGATTSRSATLSTSTSTRTDKHTKVTLSEEFTEYAPPWTLIVYRYGDKRSTGRLKVTGKVVLEGEVVEKGYMVNTKRGGPKPALHKLLSEYKASLRTFDVIGEISIVGSDRLVHTEILSRPLDSKDPKDCGPPDPWLPEGWAPTKPPGSNAQPAVKGPG